LRETLRKRARPAPKDLTLDVFRVMADWYYAAILEATRLDDFKPSPKWIASRLGIREIEAKFALEKLVELELLHSVGGTYEKRDHWLDTKDKHVTNAALKKRQRQVLELSGKSLAEDPIELRNHSAVTVPIDPKKIPEAKKRIQAFLWNLADELSAGEKSEIYELSVQLFPLTKGPRV
jgi:uncharacterized protein (TIGR02147 family)